MSKPRDPNRRDIIFEAPKAELPENVRVLMEKAEAQMKRATDAADDLLGQPLEIYFSIVNDRVLYSMPRIEKEAAPGVAKSIIRAVQEYAVDGNVKVDAVQAPSSQLGEKKIVYDKLVRIDWAKKMLFTNFKPSESRQFFGAMALVVESLQGAAPKETPAS